MKIEVNEAKTAVIVDDQLFVKVDHILASCPFCPDDGRIFVDLHEGFTPRFGCTMCNRWFGKPVRL